MNNMTVSKSNRTYLNAASILTLLVLAGLAALFFPATPAAGQDATPAVSFDSPAAQVPENSGTYSITLNISPALTTASTVSLRALHGDPKHTAKSALFTLPASVTLPAGQTTATATITINDNDVVSREPSSTIVLGLFAPDKAPYTLESTKKMLLLHVQDDDEAQLSFASTEYTVAEGGLASINVRLDKALDYDINVRFDFGPDADTGTTDAGEEDYNAFFNSAAVRSGMRTNRSPALMYALEDTVSDEGEVLNVTMANVYLGTGSRDPAPGVKLSKTPAVITIVEPRNPTTAPAGLDVRPGSGHLYYVWDPHPDTVTDYDLHYTSASEDDVADDAEASGSDPASGWVNTGFTIKSKGKNRTFHTISGLANGTEYRTRVRATREVSTTVNGVTTRSTARGPWGQFDKATPQGQPPPPTGLTAAPDNGHARLSWNAVDGAEAYHFGISYQRKLDRYEEHYSVRPPASAGPVIHYDLHGLYNGREYQVRIRSCSFRLALPGLDFGCGPWSANSVTVMPEGTTFGRPEPSAGELKVFRGPGRLRVVWSMVTPDVEIHYTSNPDAPKTAPADEFDPALGWVNEHFQAVDQTLGHTIAGLHGQVTYRVRLREFKDGAAAGPWLFAEGTPTTMSRVYIAEHHRTQTVREHFGGYRDEIQVPVFLYPALEEDTDVAIDVLGIGTAKRFIDFTLSPAVLRFPAGEHTAYLTIRGNGPDKTTEGDRTAYITLKPRGPYPPYTIENDKDAAIELTVKDNSVAQTDEDGEPQFRLGVNQASIREGESLRYEVQFLSEPDSNVVVHSRVAYDDSNGRQRHQFRWFGQSVDRGQGQVRFIVEIPEDDVNQGDIVYYIVHHLCER